MVNEIFNKSQSQFLETTIRQGLNGLSWGGLPTSESAVKNRIPNDI